MAPPENLTRFFRDRRGNVALLTALLAPLMMLFAGGAIDFSRWSHQRASLKEVSDLLATRGAREFLLANASETSIKAIIGAAIANDIASPYDLPEFTHTVDVDMTNATVTVSLNQRPTSGLILTNFVPYSDDIDAVSTAVARGGMKVCVVALHESDDRTINAEMNANLNAEECSILSNSKSTSGVRATDTARVDANLTCSAGGYEGNLANFNPLPTTDCPQYEDPLSAREPDTFGSCTVNSVTELGTDFIATEALAGVTSVADGAIGGVLDGLGVSELYYTSYTLNPGVYCGGINIGTDADVTLNPGVYVIKDGPLAVALGGRIRGKGVSFHLVGDDATFYFGAQSRIELSAPETGALAGILFFEDRDAPEGRFHQILSANARELIGTFYLPRGTMRVASLLPVADKSAYTAIVANKLDLAGSPTLVLNADYSATDVPVPAGIGPVGGTIYLRE